MEEEKIILTDNGKIVLGYMQLHDEIFVGKDLIDLTGVKGIYPVLHSLIRKHLVEESDPITRDFTNNKGETKPKDYKTYVLTDLGRAYVIEEN